MCVVCEAGIEPACVVDQAIETECARPSSDDLISQPTSLANS
jgi:hypothetical protein